MALYTIKDLERLSGVKAHTIRIWEQRYGVLKPKRTETNIRRYNDEEMKLLLNISQLLKHGGKISKVSKLTTDELSSELETISNLANTPEDYYLIHIDKLIIAMVEFNEPKFEKVITTTSIKFGFEATMLNVIFPFLHKLGIMWQTGDANVAQEHFISNLIRRKMIVAIDGLLIPDNPKQRYILFLPEGELHELGLLFGKYLLNARGIQTLYLGQSVPLAELIEAAKVYKPDGLLTFITSPDFKENVNKYVETIRNHFPIQDILVAGSQILYNDLVSFKNVTFLRSVPEFVAFIEK